MTPQQLFEHRLAALLGLTLGQVGDLPQSELDRWDRYWAEEPWGSYRDNMHAAMICATLIRPHLADNATSKMSDFMFETRQERTARLDAEAIATRLQFEALARSAERRKKRKRK